MTGPLATATIAVSLAVALWAVVQLIGGIPLGRPLQIAVGVLEAVVIAFAIWGVVSMVGDTHEFARWEVIGYLLGMCLLPIGALWWTRTDRTRAGTGVLLVIALVMPVLVLRVQQVWAGPHG